MGAPQEIPTICASLETQLSALQPARPRMLSGSCGALSTATMRSPPAVRAAKRKTTPEVSVGSLLFIGDPAGIKCMLGHVRLVLLAPLF